VKAQFKYAFRAGMSPRVIVFAIIFVMNLAFLIPQLFGILPPAAQITAVSLSGTAIAVMAVFNFVGDTSIIRRMFNPPGAVFYALTPAPRRNSLIASLVSMLTMDFITMIITISGTIFLSLGLGSYYSGISVTDMLNFAIIEPWFVFGTGALIITTYLLIVMVIVFCKAVRRSLFYTVPAGGLLTFLLGVGIFYMTTVSTLLLAPFGVVTRYSVFFTVTVGNLGISMYALLMLIISAILFILTSRLMERKINI